jgi:4-hydroxy-2-oxoheptanedioate aldolase
VRFANEQTLILPQIETMDAVRNIEALVRVEGIDGFIVGPRDLSMAMGFYDGPAHPEVRAVIDHVFEVVLGADLWIGTTAPTGEEAADLVARGARIILGSVAWLLKAGAGRFFEAVRQGTP